MPDDNGLVAESTSTEILVATRKEELQYFYIFEYIEIIENPSYFNIFEIIEILN